MSFSKVILPLISVIVFLILVLAVIALFTAKSIGTEVGISRGQAAGRFIGSYEGVTKGLAEGAEEGKNAGMSAEDTEVSIGNKIQTIGKLEVLSASVVMHDILNISTKYKALLAFYGDITFTVDLYDAQIVSDGKAYEITLPMPEATLRINDEKSQKLAKKMNHSWTGSTQEGYESAVNSIKKLVLNAEETVANYDTLMDSAVHSAEKQVAFLIQSSTREEVVVHVRFRDKKSGENS